MSTSTVISPAAEIKVAAAAKKKADLAEKKNAKVVAAAKKKADLAEKKNAAAAAAAENKAIKAAAKAAAEEKKNAPSSKNSTVAKNGFKAEAAICSQEGIKLAFELYFKLPIKRIICIKDRKKSDIKIEFVNETEITLQNKDGEGKGFGWSVDRRNVDAYNDEPLTKLLKAQCLKQGTEKPVISCDVSKKVINMCMLGIEEEYVPKYFTHTKSDKTTGQIVSMSICPTEKLVEFFNNKVYPIMNILPPKRTGVYLSPNLYFKRKGSKKDHSPDDIQLMLKNKEELEKLYTPIFPLPQTTPQ